MSIRVWNTLFCTLLAIFTFAQEHRCGFDRWVDATSRSDADFFDRLESVEHRANLRSFARQADDEIHSIPIVFHVLHRGEEVGDGPNISAAQIKSAVEYLNQAFSGTGDYTTRDARIQFVLATIDPDCAATTGILRRDISALCSEGDCYDEKGITELNQFGVKQSSMWPARSYLNVWVVSEIDDNDGGAGIQGYAQFPGFDEETDGVVMMYNAIGYDPDGRANFNLKSSTNRNNIFTHEVGHALGLYHSFEGDDIDRNGTGDRCPSVDACGAFLGDCVDDTPPHIRSQGDCDLSDINVCDGGNSRAGFIHNFMDYSSQTCQTEFTAGQVGRMRDFCKTLRRSWTTSIGLNESIPDKPIAAICSPQTQNPSSSWDLGIHRIAVGPHEHTSGSAFADGGYQANLCTNWNLEAGESYDLLISTGAQNAQNVKVFADFDGDGSFNPSEELVMESSMAKEHIGKLKIPSSTKKNSPLRLRAIADYPGFEIDDACYQPLYGQVEDYSFNVGGKTEPDDVEIPIEDPDPIDTPDDPVDDTEEEEEPEVSLANTVGLELTASPVGRRVRLRWSALDDREVDRYVLERSPDEKAFSRVYTLRSSRKLHSRYLAYDFKPETFYRIQVVPRSGEPYFSETVEVTSSSSAGFDLYPNPRRQEATIAIHPHVKGFFHTIELMDLSGKVIRRQFNEDPRDVYSMSVPYLARGIYIIRALGESTVQTEFLSQF